MSEYQIVLDYLLQNNLIESEEYADGFISVMSENWIDSILNEELSYITERRRFKAVRDEATGKLKKVKQEKTPLYRDTTPAKEFERLGKSGERFQQKGTLGKNKKTGKWEKFKPHDQPDYHKSIKVVDDRALAGRMKQGMSTTPPHKRVDKSVFGQNSQINDLLGNQYRRHSHGGRSEGKGEIGTSRGVRKQKGAKLKEVSPVSKFLAHKKRDEKLKKEWEGSLDRFTRQDVEHSMSLSRRTNPLNLARRRAEQRRQSKG